MIHPFYEKCVLDFTTNETGKTLHYELFLNTTIFGNPYFSMTCYDESDFKKRTIFYGETDLYMVFDKLLDTSVGRMSEDDVDRIIHSYSDMLIEGLKHRLNKNVY